MSEKAHYVEFEYVNWRGDRHTYIVDIDAGHLPGFGFGRPERHWYLSGTLVTRDGDPRPEMEGNRRRSFELLKLENLREIPRPTEDKA